MMTGSYNIVTYTLEIMVNVADIDETAMATLSNICPMVLMTISQVTPPDGHNRRVLCLSRSASGNEVLKPRIGRVHRCKQRSSLLIQSFSSATTHKGNAPLNIILSSAGRRLADQQPTHR
jgi:hypothetical protein